MLTAFLGCLIFCLHIFRLMPKLQEECMAFLNYDSHQKQEVFKTTIDDTLIQPPFLSRLDPFWYSMFEREWKIFTDAIIKKFVISWYRTISHDLDEDFINSLSADINAMGCALFDMFNRIELIHGKTWTMCVINDALEHTIINHILKWKKTTLVSDVMEAEVDTSDPYVMKNNSSEMGEPAKVLLDNLTSKIFAMTYEKLATTASLSNNHARMLIDTVHVSSDILKVILRDLVLAEFVQKFELREWIRKYLISRDPSINLTSLDIDSKKIDTSFERNLSAPILQLIWWNTDRKSERMMCLLVWHMMRVPILGKWLVNWANAHVHRICLRLVHPWMLCKCVRHIIDLIENRPPDYSRILSNPDDDRVQRYIARVARNIIKCEPKVTDAPYLLLKILDIAISI